MMRAEEAAVGGSQSEIAKSDSRPRSKKIPKADVTMVSDENRRMRVVGVEPGVVANHRKTADLQPVPAHNFDRARNKRVGSDGPAACGSCFNASPEHQ